MGRNGVGRVRVAAATVVAAGLLAAYSDHYTPLWRTTSPSGCDCGGSPGGGGADLTARSPELRPRNDENWLPSGCDCGGSPGGGGKLI